MMPVQSNILGRIRISLVAASLVLLSASEAPGQGAFTFAIRGYDGVTPVPGQDTVFIGRNPRATYCIDPYTFFYRTVEFLEYELPPQPPTGVFDMRSRQFRGGDGGCTGAGDWTQGMRFDVRGSVTRTQVDTFQILFQLGGPTPPMTFTWETGYNVFCDSMKMQDAFGGILLNVNMFTTQTTSLTGALTGLDRVNIYLYGAPGATLVSPANGSSVPTSVTLSWNARSGATRYHLQVATDSLFAAGIVFNDSSITGTSSGVPGLNAPVTYYWRVSAGNALGLGAYSPTWHFTTQLQLPPAPTLLSPPNGQQGTLTTVPLRWNQVGGATSYRLQVATDSTFSSGIIVDDSTLTATTDTIGPLLNGTRYFWHVRAKNQLGSGPYSATWNFTTVFIPPPAPVLQSPPDGAVNVSALPTLIWNAAPTASSYHLQVARDTAFGILVVDDSTISGTSRQVGPLATSTTYYWHVQAKNTGGSSPYSSRFMFTTSAAPPPPSLISPADSATRLPRTPTFVWTRVTGALSYHLQIGTDPTFTTLVVNDSTIFDTTKTIPPLPYAARLLWRVRARNASGGGEYSPVRVFTVMLEPSGVPTLVYPANNAAGIPSSVTLRWTNTTPLAAGYHLVVAFDTLMTNTFISDTPINDTTRTVQVIPSTAFYWAVRAYNTEHTFGAFSAVRRFTSGNFPPAIPTPLYPLSGDTGLARNICFRWTSVPGAQTYRVQVSTNIGFTQIIFDDSTLTELTFCPGILPPRMSCFWRVRAKGNSGSSQYSAVQGFTTGTLVPVEEEQAPEIPSTFVLRQNYPNPFNPSTTIPFEIPENSFVTLTVYDVLGREIQLLMNQNLSVGHYTVRWDGRNENGTSMPSGMYFVRMTGVPSRGERAVVAVQKMLLVK